MIIATQHKLAKWLTELLQAILDMHSKNCIKQALAVVNYIQSFRFSSQNKFTYPLDIRNQFTCVPIQETIDIRADALCRSRLSHPPIPETVSFERVKFTMSVKVSFNYVM